VKVSHIISLTLSTALVALTLTSQVASAQQYKKITRLGTSQAVCAGGIETAEQLQEYFANNPSNIRDLLADSGWTGSADDLLAAVANGEMIERAYPVGTRFQWTGAKKDGAYVVNRYREWAGAKSFEGFQIDLKSDCQVYHIAIPKACCNVSLISVNADTSSECTEPLLLNPLKKLYLKKLRPWLWCPLSVPSLEPKRDHVLNLLGTWITVIRLA